MNVVRRRNMKSHRYVLSIVLTLLSTVAFAQSDAQKPVAQSDAQKSSLGPAPSAAQNSFETMKSVGGEGKGPVSAPEMPQMSGGKPMHLSLRVTSRGNALVHEFQEAGDRKSTRLNSSH